MIGLDEGTFPSGRTLAESAEPARVLEEERRLAYVAWTRARGMLLLVYDPARPSPFLREAFTEAELDLVPPEAPANLLSTLALADARGPPLAPPVPTPPAPGARRCRAGTRHARRRFSPSSSQVASTPSSAKPAISAS